MIFFKHKEDGVAPLVLLCALAALVYLIFLQLFPTPSIKFSKEEKAAEKIEQQNLIEDKEKVKTAIREASKKQIIMKINVELNKVWVNFRTWKNMDVTEKQKLITVLSKYFDYEGSLALVNLYDYGSGKKIGSYSLWSGLQFY